MRNPLSKTRAVGSLELLAASLLLSTVLSACGSASVGAQPALTRGASRFLGSDVSLLQSGGEGRAAYLHINPNVDWSGYSKILLRPVEFWDAADSGISRNDQQMLSSYFYNKLRENLSTNFMIVNHPGPGVMIMQVAIINAQAATPGLRTISVAVPQARILNYAQSLATGHAAFAGSAVVALKITDSTTSRLLAESVDKRVGGMALSQAAQLRWGDAEAAMDHWAQRIAKRGAELRAQKYEVAGEALRLSSEPGEDASPVRAPYATGAPGYRSGRARNAPLARRVNIALRRNRRLNGAHAYTVSRNTVVLYGKVFDEPDRRLAVQTAARVRGVRHVVNRLDTSTGQWMAEQVRINDAIAQVNGLQDVSVQVIGRKAFLSGQVRSEADKATAVRLVSSSSNLEPVNFIWVVPGPLFFFPTTFFD